MADISGLSPGIQALFDAPAKDVYKGESLDRDSFLKLLTTQLQNQNPLEPMANEDFIAQLTTFSSLEQSMQMNSQLEGIYMGITAMNNSSMASLLGTSIIAFGDHFKYEGSGDVELSYAAPEGTTNAVVSVYDEDDHLVDTINLGEVSGEGSFTWDGVDENGDPVPEGVYRFSITGTDVDGNPIDVEEMISGTITEMDYSNGTPLPSLSGVVVELADIIRLTTGDEDDS